MAQHPLPSHSSSSATLSSSSKLTATTNATTTATTTPALRPVTPLLQLQHLVLSDICPIRPTWFHAFFDCHAYHRVPLQTLEFRNLYTYKHRAEVNKFGGLAAHLKYGNFPDLSSLAIHENTMTESAAAALIDGLDKGCGGVTSLSLSSDCRWDSEDDCGLLVKALSEATGSLLRSLQMLNLNWRSLTSAEVLKFFFGMNIDTATELYLPRGPNVPESAFRFPFPALLSLNITQFLEGLPLETLKVVIRAYLESGLRCIDLYGTYWYLSDACIKDCGIPSKFTPLARPSRFRL